MRRWFALGVAVIVALSATAGTSTEALAAPAAACEKTYDPPRPEPKWVEVFSDSDNDPDVPTGILIEAPGGTTACKGSMRNGVACQVKGAATVRVTIQDYIFFKVPANRTATLTLSKQGELGCVLQQAAAGVDPRMNEPLPYEVRAQIMEDLRSCTNQGGKLSGVENYVRFADFNNDGRTDYLLVTGALTCSTAASLYCGQLGCPVTGYVSQANGKYPPSLNLSALETEIKRVKGREIVVVSGQTLKSSGLVPVSSRWSYSKGRWVRVR